MNRIGQILLFQSFVDGFISLSHESWQTKQNIRSNKVIKYHEVWKSEKIELLHTSQVQETGYKLIWLPCLLLIITNKCSNSEIFGRFFISNLDIVTVALFIQSLLLQITEYTLVGNKQTSKFKRIKFTVSLYTVYFKDKLLMK